MKTKMIGAWFGALGLLWCSETQAQLAQKSVAYQRDDDVNNYDPYWRRFGGDTPREEVVDPAAIRFELGAGLLGMATLWGSGDMADLLRPIFFPRFRVHKRVALVLEPGFAGVDFDKISFGMVGARPALHWTMIEGQNRWKGSMLYGITGLDFWFPTSEPQRTPTMFIGGDVGLGVTLASKRFSVGFGSEIRAVVRGGAGNQVSALVQNMSDLRFGVEVRPLLVYMCF